jgi:hypothetical protein
MGGFLANGILAAVVALGALVISLSQARADIQTLRGTDNSIWISAGGAFFNYKEPSIAPNLPDSEHGELPSVAVGASMLVPEASKGWAHNLFLSIQGTGSFGDAHYNGAYFYYPTTPLQGSTSETIWTIESKIGKAFPIGPMLMLIPYGELGYRYWDRNLGGGQVEDYQNGDLQAGLMVQFSPVRRLSLSAYGSGGTTFSPEMETSGTTYDLGSAGTYKVGAKIGFDMTQELELFTTLDYDHLSYGQSGVNNGAYEPTSHTEDTAWRVGIGYHFR